MNLDPEFRSQTFRDRLSTLGVELEIDAIETLVGAHSWNDYVNSDAALAVRNLTRYDASKKPASKLINAWIAGVVPLLGPEPAFRELRQSPLDFLEVRTPDDVLNAIKSLNESPEQYDAIISNGMERANEFRDDIIASQWISLLNGAIAKRFLSWESTGSVRRSLRLGYSFLAEPFSKSIDRYRIRHGSRILDGGEND